MTLAKEKRDREIEMDMYERAVKILQVIGKMICNVEKYPFGFLCKHADTGTHNILICMIRTRECKP